jgi:flagellar motor switch protein FliM
MTGHSKVHHAVPVEKLTRLKPGKLGRHYHRVPHYIRELFTKHPRLIGDYFLRNYRINLELHKTLVQESIQQAPECIYQSARGKLGFSIERSLLAEALECYYGGSCRPGLNPPPPSTSEQRLHARIGQDLCLIFLRAILACDEQESLQPCDNDYEEVSWEYVVNLQFTSHITGKPASIHLYMDQQLVDELTECLSSPSTPAPLADPAQQLCQLPIRLNCVVASVEMPLNQVLALQAGDILQVRLLERCDVCVNQQKLFRGSIFEEDGCLYLTSLQHVEQP